MGRWSSGYDAKPIMRGTLTTWRSPVRKTFFIPFSLKKRERLSEREKFRLAPLAYIIERKTIGIAGGVQQKKDKIIELRRERRESRLAPLAYIIKERKTIGIAGGFRQL